MFGGTHQKGGNHSLGTDIEKLRDVGLTGKKSQAQNSAYAHACACKDRLWKDTLKQLSGCLWGGKEEQGSQGRKETYTILELSVLFESFRHVKFFPV